MATDTKPAPSLTPTANGKPQADAPAFPSMMPQFEDKLNAKISARARRFFDPSIIGAIIAALLPLLQNCFKPTPQSVRRRFGNRVRLANAIHNQLPNATWSECYEHADDVLAVADEAPDNDVNEFILECCR